MAEREIRREAERYLGMSIDNSEWDRAKKQAEKKLCRIIDREGDAGGERRQPGYLAQLIAEAVRTARLCTYTTQLSGLMNYLEEQSEIKRGQPVS